MKLGDRFRQAGLVQTAAPAEQPSSGLRARDQRPPAEPVMPVDPLDELKQRAQEGLFARLGSQLFDASLSQVELHRFVERELDDALKEENARLSDEERQQVVDAVKDDVLGYGPIQQFLDDDDVSEIMVNGGKGIYIERKGKITKTGVHFVSHEHLRRVIERIVSQVGRRIDEASAMVDARLPDGSRVNAVIPPLSVDGPMLTIRKFSKDPLTVSDLVAMKSMTQATADFLEACVKGKLNILIAGGTGTGKTTMLNIMSGFIPDNERIVTIEDSVELQLRQDHVIRLETRPANSEGRGEVAIRDLLKNTLRMRPDRIVVGECRGGEALDMLQAMNTGHEGSLSTVHANTSRDAIARLETMVLMAGMELPVRAIREQIASAVDLIVHITRLRDGTRRVTSIDEVVGMEGERITMADLFTFDYDAGFDEDGKFAGSIKPTGIRPMFSERLEQEGISMAGSLFGPAMTDFG